MTNRNTLKFSIFAAAILALALPAVASAQWGRYPDDRDYGRGRYDDRGLRDSVHRLDRLAKDFEREMDRSPRGLVRVHHQYPEGCSHDAPDPLRARRGRERGQRNQATTRDFGEHFFAPTQRVSVG